MNEQSIREDILVSICLSEYSANENNDATLRAIASRIGGMFKFWEILIVTDASRAEHCEHLLESIENIRLIKVRQNLHYYRKRVVAAAEAIGDIVVLTSVDEFSCLDIIGMIETCSATGSIVTGVRSKSNIFGTLVKALGLASGFHVATNDMTTAAYPRTLLNLLLAHPSRQLALRFSPRDSSIPVIEAQCIDGKSPERSIRGLGRRLGIIQKLFISSAPLILSIVALLSSLVAVISLMYAAYAVVIWLTFDDIQPGWLTTSLAISFTASFLGVALLGVTMALQSILEKLSPDILDDVIDEISTVDLFDKVGSELNVEIVAQNDKTSRIDQP